MALPRKTHQMSIKKTGTVVRLSVKKNDPSIPSSLRK